MLKGIIKFIMAGGKSPVKILPLAERAQQDLRLDSSATLPEEEHPSPASHQSTTDLGEFYHSRQNYTSLVLPRRGINDSQILDLFKSIAGNTVLECLVLSRNAITNVGIKDMSSHLAGNALRILRIDDNFIGDEGGFEIASILEASHSLQKLSINNNKIGLSGAIALADALKVNTSLEYLSLDSNCIGDEGISALAESIKCNSTLKYLRCDANEIGDNGAINLAVSLSLRECVALSYLSLNLNQITDSGAEEFSEALRCSPELKIKFRGNYIGCEVEGRLKDEFGERVELADQQLLLNDGDFWSETELAETQGRAEGAIDKAWGSGSVEGDWEIDDISMLGDDLYSFLLN